MLQVYWICMSYNVRLYLILAKLITTVFLDNIFDEISCIVKQPTIQTHTVKEWKPPAARILIRNLRVQNIQILSYLAQFKQFDVYGRDWVISQLFKTYSELHEYWSICSDSNHFKILGMQKIFTICFIRNQNMQLIHK